MLAFVAGVKRGREIWARESTWGARGRKERNLPRAWSRALPFRTPATQATKMFNYTIVWPHHVTAALCRNIVTSVRAVVCKYGKSIL